MRSLWPEVPGGRAWDVIGVGECSLDHVCLVEALPATGGKTALRDFALRPGGTIATALLACVRLGLRSAYLGSVGDDRVGRDSLAPLAAAGIDTSRVRVVPGAASRFAIILVEAQGGERTVLWRRDPRLRLTAADWPSNWSAQARALLVDATDPELSLRAAHEARTAGVPVLLDCDRVGEGIEALLGQVDFPIVSRGFAEEFSGTGSLRDALTRMVGLGARLAVVTLGEWGACALGAEGELTSPGFRIDPVDTTGAGDAFHAAFVSALLGGADAETALRTANAAAALSCLGAGAQGGLPTRDRLDTFLHDHEPCPWRDPEA